MALPMSNGKQPARVSFSRIREVLEMPNLIAVQQNSYEWFLRQGLREIFRDLSPIQDFTEKLVLEFTDYSLGEPKYSVDECKERDVNYAAPLRVKVRLINKETGEVKEQEVFMGDFPLMTDKGTFIINGAERVIVSQLVRSPGTYYSEQIDPNGKRLFSATVIPNRGAWLEFESDASDVVYVRVDRTRKLPATVLLRALGHGSNEEIMGIMGETTQVKNTLDKDSTNNSEEALLEVYKRLRPGEPPTVESANNLVNSLFFDPRRYDLATVGRYKLNKKLSIRRRAIGKYATDDVVDEETGEIIVSRGDQITRDIGLRIDECGIDRLDVQTNDGSVVRIVSNTPPFPWRRAIGNRAAEHIVDEETGEIIASPGDLITRGVAVQMEKSGIESVRVIDRSWYDEIIGKYAADDVVDKNTGESILVRGDEITRDLAMKMDKAGVERLRVTGRQWYDAIGRHVVHDVVSDNGEIIMSAGDEITRDIAIKMDELGIEGIQVTDRQRALGKHVADDVVDEKTGEIIVSRGDEITPDVAVRVSGHGIAQVSVGKDGEVEVINLSITSLTKESVTLSKKYSIASREHSPGTSAKTITKEDIVACISFLFGLFKGVGDTDDIDHLGNRRLKSVGELLQNQFRIGLSRMERVVRERMTIQDVDIITPQALINIRPVVASVKEFFGSSQLSQFMDQTNPLAELTHKRRLSALGPGGLSRERASFEVRDVHHSHYGRMCPIETPEGPNIGLIGSLSTYARVNEYGFMETPYRRVDRKTYVVTEDIVYLTADEEDECVIAQANEPLNQETGQFINTRVSARFKHDIREVDAHTVDYMDVSPKQVVSIATSLIPFLENDDANRALMGSNMQRQAVPLIRTDSPLVGTGVEFKAAKDSGVVVFAKNAGMVQKVTAEEIVIMNDQQKLERYRLTKFARSNQGTCINQRPVVRSGMRVEAGDVLADGPSTSMGELALGKNVLVAFMPWEGYNYEDAILISERLVREDAFTSIHIEEYEAEARDTKLGPEEITRDIPNVGEDVLKDLDERGIIRIGAEVRTGDVLVGKVTPKGETELTAEERLLRAIFGEKAREVRDTSLRVPHGESGIVVDVKVFSRENGDELAPGVNHLVRVYIAQKRKISEGDKMAGRHGNKGVIARIVPEEDMPFLPDGTPVGIVLNPLGVPSRMNLGQVLECHLGWAAHTLGLKVASPVFDGAGELDIAEYLERAGLPDNGKSVLYDGRTGEKFDNPVTVGYIYMMKLAHLVDDKIHARSTGPYSLVTQQPLGGKAQFGGQRFGEMEVWALEAYGAAYTLQELLTVKSDDVVGRVRTYEAIVKGDNVPEPGVPESFKVLIKELQSLALDVKVLSEDSREIEILESDDDVNETARELELAIDGEQERRSGRVQTRDRRAPIADEVLDEEEEEVVVPTADSAIDSVPSVDDDDDDVSPKSVLDRILGSGDDDDAEEEEEEDEDKTLIALDLDDDDLDLLPPIKDMEEEEKAQQARRKKRSALARLSGRGKDDDTHELRYLRQLSDIEGEDDEDEDPIS